MQKLIKYLISNNDNPSFFLKFQVVINASNAMNIRICELVLEEYCITFRHAWKNCLSKLTEYSLIANETTHCSLLSRKTEVNIWTLFL